MLAINSLFSDMTKGGEIEMDSVFVIRRTMHL